MGIVLGLDCKLYRGTAGATAATEMKNVKNVTCNISTGEADITTRAANGWKATASTLKEGSIEWGMLYDTADADMNAISISFFSNTPISLFVSDGSGSGLDTDASITGFNIEQNLEEGVNISVTAKPTLVGGSASRAPSWKTGA